MNNNQNQIDGIGVSRFLFGYIKENCKTGDRILILDGWQKFHINKNQ
jgi:hypothetical protein